MIERPIKNPRSSEKRLPHRDLDTPIFCGTLDELHRSYLHYRLLYEFGVTVLSCEKIEAVLDTLLDRLVALSNAERALILLMDPDGELVFQAGRNLNHEQIAQPAFEVSWSVIRDVHDKCEAVYLPNTLGSEKYKKAKSVHRLKILSILCLPLIHDGRVFGVLYADHRGLQGAFGEDVFALMRKFVDLISPSLFFTLQRKQLEKDLSDMAEKLTASGRRPTLVGHSEEHRRTLQFIQQAADTAATVLLEGESGTGKELVARALHEESRRQDEPFVCLNCGALPENLLESELFGHVRGAFTGAVSDHRGWFETANGGTIFFDEISEMSPALQVKLLRVLQSGEYSAVGSSEIKQCDVRVIAATNVNLEVLVREKRFRSDLYYRLNILFHRIEPLRRRRQDIPLLAAYYLEMYKSQYDKPGLSLAPAALSALEQYDFPGNVRELENMMQRAVVLAQGNKIGSELLPANVTGKAVGAAEYGQKTFSSAKQMLISRFERDYIIKALAEADGVVARAARNSGMHAKNFFQKIREHNIDARSFKK